MYHTTDKILLFSSNSKYHKLHTKSKKDDIVFRRRALT